MDIDCTLTSTAATLATTSPAVPFGTAFGKLPPAVRVEVLHLDGLMRQIDAARSTLRACVQLATPGCSAETLRRLYYGKGTQKGRGWKDIGLAALIDHRRCGGCGLPGCKAEREDTLHAETLRVWQAGAITSDKRGLSESWKVLMRDLSAGKPVAGVGTWRELYARLRPYGNPPENCPWSMHRPPAGWSLGSFMKHKPAESVYKLGQKGSFEAWSELPEVRMDLSGLRPFEWLVVDDHRLDFKVFVDVPGRGVQLVELWGLFVMDVATRMIVSFALKPRVMRDDGTCMAFEHRDMQHLISHVIGTYGVPADFQQTWIVENAAAAVSTECEALVKFVTGGRVKIKRSGIQVGDHNFSGFPERWGNYRGKRWIEAYFGPLDIVLGGVKGQMGSDYWAKPGSFDARQAFGNRLTKFLDKCPAETRAKLNLPFEWAGQAHWLVSEAVELLNHRSDHQLEGFNEVRFFAYDRESQMMPLCPQLALLHGTQTHLETFSKVPQELQEMWLSNGGKPRRVTPAEKMAMTMPKLLKLAPEAIMDLLFDEVTTWKREPLIWRGGDVMDIEVRRGRTKQRVRFHGVLPGMELGQRVIARINADRIECGLWLLDEKRRFIGWMRFEADPTHEDMDGLHRMMGAQIKALAQVKKKLNRITAGPADALARIGDMAELTEAIDTLTTPVNEAEEIPALPESAGFIKAVKTRAKTAEPSGSDADFYLRMKQ